MATGYPGSYRRVGRCQPDAQCDFQKYPFACLAHAQPRPRGLTMTKIHLPLIVLFALLIHHAQSAEAPALIERPDADRGPTQISVGIWVADISNIDSAQQNFTAELAVVLRWKDSRLAHIGKGVARYS